MNISKNEIPKFAEEIADNIYLFINGQIDKFNFELLEEPLIFKHKKLSFSYNYGGFMVSPLTSDLVYDTIKKKEEKIDYYINKTIDEIWLLIVVSHSHRESFEIFEEDEHLFQNFNSKFDKIYILEDFKSKIHKVK